MQRLFTYWSKYCPTLPTEVKRFVTDHVHIHHHRKSEIVKLPDEDFRYWGLVLSGLIAGYVANRHGEPQLRELLLPLDFFTGSEHPFTTRPYPIEYRVIDTTDLLLLPIAIAREGQQRYREVAELFHVLKQKKINFLRHLLAVYQEDRYYDRYCEYRRLFPHLTHVAPQHAQYQLLRMSETSYYRVKKQYLNNNRV